ncbi:hypothetical protein T492DRAFT_1043004 [Pavlovales sp. CCMP2436]|nr:hypothetical protein T492DRAFT_1043004 [Pavlovales sp. CCMP2436]
MLIWWTADWVHPAPMPALLSPRTAGRRGASAAFLRVSSSRLRGRAGKGLGSSLRRALSQTVVGTAQYMHPGAPTFHSPTVQSSATDTATG